MLILSDIDGVVLDWKTKYCVANEIDPNSITKYDGDVFSIERVSKFNLSLKFGRLLPTKQADKWIPILAKASNVNLMFISSAIPQSIDSSRVINRRMYNMKRVFGVVSNKCPIIMLPLRCDKHDVYNRYIQAFATPGEPTIVVEDHYNYALDTAMSNPTCNVLIMRQPYNQEPDEIRRALTVPNLAYVDDWKDVYNIVRNMDVQIFPETGE